MIGGGLNVRKVKIIFLQQNVQNWRMCTLRGEAALINQNRRHFDKPQACLLEFLCLQVCGTYSTNTCDYHVSESAIFG